MKMAGLFSRKLDVKRVDPALGLNLPELKAGIILLNCYRMDVQSPRRP
jgi:hypothetical protein